MRAVIVSVLPLPGPASTSGLEPGAGCYDPAMS